MTSGGPSAEAVRSPPDTVQFPALHKIVSAKRLKELGEQFEKEEDRLFGDEGFEKTVEQVAAIVKQLGIYDLSLFKPKCWAPRQGSWVWWPAWRFWPGPSPR